MKQVKDKITDNPIWEEIRMKGRSQTSREIWQKIWSQLRKQVVEQVWESITWSSLSRKETYEK